MPMARCSTSSATSPPPRGDRPTTPRGLTLLELLIVIASFPSVFIGVFFGSSLLIELIFSLDGLGRLGFEAAVQRDYPVIFGTLFAFGLIGLIVGIISDLMYVFVDPRIDFEKREG